MKTKYKTPELLSPAGNLEKLKVAVCYGADAVYLGGQEFGLRVASDNFTDEELAEGVLFAHSHGVKVFVVLNSFLHDRDLESLPAFVGLLSELNVDAVIVSDLGVIKTVQKHSQIPIHLSTQASCLNVQAAKLWKSMGVSRIVLGREVSIAEAAKIKKEAQIEVELFVHGSMCMAYSGNCTISNFTQGRDSNRGGCAHSCRFEYSLDFDSKPKVTSYFMSSKDLQGIERLGDYIENSIDSIKIEGRMKSPLYAATTTKVYSQALAFYAQHGHFQAVQIESWREELSKISHRSYTEASLIKKAGGDSIFDERESIKSLDYINVGIIRDVNKDKYIVMEVKNTFDNQQTLETLGFSGDVFCLPSNETKSLMDLPIEKTKPNTLVKLPYIKGIECLNLVRMKK